MNTQERLAMLLAGPFDSSGEIPEDLRKAISRLKGAQAAESLARGARNPVKDPAACQTPVDNGASPLGRKYRSWQCRNPVRGQVDGKCYCAEHFTAAEEAYRQRLADRALVAARGIDPDNLPTLPPRKW